VTKNRSTPLAQKLHREATREENHLWYEFLSKYPVRFRRQKVIGKYIVDFDCSSAKIALELDGGQHFEDHALTYDDERTQWLNENGIKVLRFLNLDVRKNLSDVCTTIDNIVKDRLDELVK
jgi:very-short-patch-repair endonuclease